MSRISFLVALLVAFAAWGVPSCAWAAFTVTQIATASANSGGSSSVTTSSFNVAANTWVCVGVLDAQLSGAIGSVSDSLSNSYTQSIQQSIVGEYIFYYSSAQTGITVTYNAGASSGMGISVISITGSNGTNDTAVTAGATGFSAAPSVTGAGLPTKSGELYIGIIGVKDISGGTTFTQASGWSNAFTQVSFTGSGTPYFLTGGYLVNAGSGNETYAPTLSQSAVWHVTIDAVEAAAAAATASTLTLLGVGK